MFELGVYSINLHLINEGWRIQNRDGNVSDERYDESYFLESEEVIVVALTCHCPP
jgi:hypothetical protein